MTRTLLTALLAGAALAPGFARADSAAANDPLPFGGPLAPTAAHAVADDATSPAYADDAATQPATEPAAAAPAAPTKKVGGSFGATLTQKYISRGLILNNSGVIVQPYAEIDFDLFDSKDGPIQNISPYVGGWSDLTDNHRFATHSLRTWYEFDWDVGVSMTFLTSWNLNVQYIEFTSPSGSFGTSKNIIPQLTYDDTSLWGQNNPLAFALHPYVAGLIETNGKAGSGVKLGQYLEPGINPSITLGATGNFPVTITIPLKVGLGFDNFYGGSNARKNETFGYLSAGAQISAPFKFIDALVGGTWSGTAGVAYYYYGDGTHFFNVSNVGYTDRNDVIGSFGLLCKF